LRMGSFKSSKKGILPVKIYIFVTNVENIVLHVM